MPSTSPGARQIGVPTASSNFDQILPGGPTEGLQSFTSLIFRQKRYTAYVSGSSLNILSAPKVLAHVVWFDDEAIGLAAELGTSKIAVATQGDVYVLEPVATGWSKVRWEKALVLKRDASDEARTLSWGNPGELLVGDSQSLMLFSTLPSSRSSSPSTPTVDSVHTEVRLPLWTKSLPNPVKYAAFSPTGSFIASCSLHDRFVKIWRRLSFEEGLFDYAYLAHPAPVTYVSWRSSDRITHVESGSGISRRHEEDPEILYTIAADAVLRVWRAGGVNDLDMLVLHTSINLIDAIPPLPDDARGKGNDKSSRYTLIISAHEFSQAVASAVATAMGFLNRNSTSHILEHLKEVASKEPDIFIVTDGQGRMSAWGLQSIGHKRRPQTPTSHEPFHIAAAEDFPFLIPQGRNATFLTWFEGDQLNLLAHRFERPRHIGSISWWTSSIEVLFSHHTSTVERMSQLCDWTGHSAEVTGIAFANSMLLSTARGEGTIQWKPQDYGFDLPTIRAAVDLLARRESRLLTGPMPKELFTSVGGPDLIRRYEDITTITSSNEVRIFNSRERYIEFSEIFDEPILGIALPTPPSAIAIGFSTYIDIYVRNLYGESSAWHRIKQISLAGMNISINALSWTSDNKLVLGAGNALFVAGDSFPSRDLPQEVKESLDFHEEDTTDLNLDAITRSMLNQLPVWHPNVISHFVYWGNTWIMVELLNRLHYKLKFYGEGDHIDYLLDMDEQELLETAHVPSQSINQETFAKIIDQLDQHKLPRLTRSDQDELKRVLIAFAFVMTHREGLDSNAQRYLFIWKLELQRMEDETPAAEKLTKGEPRSQTRAPKMAWREVAFASHSKTQQPLLDILILYHDKLSWETASSLGVVRWLSEPAARAQVFELIAQSEYRSSQPPDPVNATLFYLALRKKQTLLALWRIATWHKEQRTTTNFLKRDFSLPEARTAAKKNAYALMGKRRFQYAAAFFLLADDPASATSVLAGQGDDIPLALAVARVYCGDGRPELCNILEDRLLPRARQKCDRWLLSWAQSLDGNHEAAAMELIQPFDDNSIRTWQQDDPATLVLYAQLRKGARKEEGVYIMKAIRILWKMGLAIPAMQLAAKYSFAHPTVVATGTTSMQQSQAEVNGVSQGDVPSLLDGFSKPSHGGNLPNSDVTTAADASQSAVEDTKASREAQAAELLKKLRAKKNDTSSPIPQQPQPIDEKGKRAPTQFKEPNANSLLDSFGF